MKSIFGKVRENPVVRIDTCNILRHTEIVRKQFKNSADELITSLSHQMNGSAELRPNGTIVSTYETKNCRMKSVPEDDMKITLKVFMSSLDPQEVEDAVESVRDLLNVPFIAQLIIAFPLLDYKEIAEEQELKVWLERVLPMWERFENLVSCGRVFTLGVADLDVEKLKALYENVTEVRPMIDHYNIENCCTVPEELRQYAKANDIQLLVHNDPHLSTLQEEVMSAMEPFFGENAVNYSLHWVARMRRT